MLEYLRHRGPALSVTLKKKDLALFSHLFKNTFYKTYDNCSTKLQAKLHDGPPDLEKRGKVYSALCHDILLVYLKLCQVQM